MPLYKVSIVSEIVVEAENEDDAIRWLSNNDWWIEDTLRDADYCATEVARFEDVPFEWRDRFPWGYAGPMTCAQVLKGKR